MWCGWLALGPAASLALGCTPLTEEQRYERDNALVVAREAFEVRRTYCQSQGGVMVITRDGATQAQYNKWDYSRAVCVRQ